MDALVAEPEVLGPEKRLLGDSLDQDREVVQVYVLEDSPGLLLVLLGLRLPERERSDKPAQDRDPGDATHRHSPYRSTVGWPLKSKVPF